MTTAIIGTGRLGSAIARLLASGGETVRLSNADEQSARTLAADIGEAVIAAADNREAVQGADAAILALRFPVLQAVFGELGDALAGKVVVVPSNPVSADAKGKLSRVLPDGQASGSVLAGWLAPSALLAMAFGTLSADVLESSANRSPEPAVLFYATDDDRAGEEAEHLIRAAGFEPMKIGGLDRSSRLEVGGDLHDLVTRPLAARALLGEVRSPPPS
jgi:8-hydroxy-5-deazaflavin:NADPH oxidoreductase